MNNVSGMFSLHQEDELLVQVLSNPSQENTISQDTLLLAQPLNDSGLSFKLDKTRGRESSVSTHLDYNEERKKVVHRNVERRRRNEMANLYTSLRSLLPLEYVKGKRSISDHMNEAGNYTRYLQKRIKQLSDKRDRLKKLYNLSSTDAASGSSYSGLPYFIRAQLCWGGVEVVISSRLRVGTLPLSRVLELLVEEGFSVLNCIYTEVNEMSVHTIQSEANDPTRIDVQELQQKLTDLIETLRGISM